MAKICIRCNSVYERPPLVTSLDECPCGGALYETERCHACGKAHYQYHRFCGAWVCPECDHHKGLERCYCGWSETDAGHGREELVEMGETIGEDEELRGQDFTLNGDDAE
jgi:hypothetical protein